MISAWLVGIIIVVFFTLSGGLVFIFLMKGSKNSQTWEALCYQVGEGVRSVEKDKDGNIISGVKLKDLKPYVKDTIEKIDEQYGITLYKLRTLDMTTNEVKADHVEVWEAGRKVVHVLIQEGSATLLKKGYDQKTANEIFTPMPRDRLEMLKSEILIKQKRLDLKKDRVEKIVAAVMFGFAIMGLIGITYMVSSGWVKTAEIQNAGLAKYGQQQIEAAEHYQEAMRQITGMAKEKKGVTLGKVKDDPPVPPPIE